MNYTNQSMSDSYKVSEVEYNTSPMTGPKRVYGDDTIKRLALTPTAKFMGLAPPPKKEKSDFAKICASRPTTASSVRSVTRADDSPSATKTAQGKSKDTLAPVKSNMSSLSEKKSDVFVGRANVGKERSKSALVQSSGDNEISDGIKARCRCKSAAPKQVKLAAMDKQMLGSLNKPSSIAIINAPKTVPFTGSKLEAVLGEPIVDRTTSGEALAPVKKPRDLLSPMLRILDTKGQRSRYPSAVGQRLVPF